MDYTSQLLGAIKDKSFTVLSGDDSLTLPLMALGAKGVISVVANVLPRSIAEMCRAWIVGNTERAQELHRLMFPLCRALFFETNPIPVKAAMARLGLCREDLRLPLVPMSAEPRKKMLAALKACTLVKGNRP
jgi:4-hydroxy-tetrahydrodipicolinate synthase